MKQKLTFFKTTMPETRKADFYLSCFDDSVFIDFNQTENNLIYMVRISFDGYGCCDLDKQSNCLNVEDSKKFVEEIQKGKLNQEKIATLVKKAINVNKELIWNDAIEEYGLV